MARFSATFSLGRLLRPARWSASRGSEPILANVDSARSLFGHLSAKRDLVEAARLQVGPQLETRFRRYIGWLARQGYTFGSAEEAPLRFDTRRIYLRYDVHVADLSGAFALANLHEALQIPGSFQICWRHSQAEAEAADLFLKLQAFDSRYVEFGLHCAPESAWLIAERFGGRSEGIEKFVRTGAARATMNDWLAAFERDGEDAPVLRDARRRAEAHLSEIVASFRRYFGAVTTVSGHGTPLAAAYLDAVRGEPRLSAIGSYLHPVEFLNPERIREHGFACELTRFADDGLPGPRIVFENPVAEMAASYRQRLAVGGGLVALFHPASWTSDHFAPFIDAVTAPDRPDRHPRRIAGEISG
ncbi:MAG: hypothetical protein WA459_03140 [Stellaceae bacterium]